LENKDFKLGLLGKSVTHSLSPEIHGFSASSLSLSCSYQKYSLPLSEVSSFLESFKQEGGHGLNITNPYKKLVSHLISPISHPKPFNTLVQSEGKWLGSSTDGEGFYNALKRFSYELKSFDAFCFLGTGDVVESIVSFLASKAQGKKIYFLRRSDKNDLFLKDIYSPSVFLPLESKSLGAVVKEVPGKICLIQATSAPSQGEDLSYLLEGLKDFKGLFYELLYDKKSSLYYFLEEKKIPVLDGLPMLIEQALLSQKIWWGKSGSYSEIKEQLEKKLN